MSRNKEYIHIINSKRWRDCRLIQLRHHPLCQMCEAKGLVKLAEEVHHITPIESVSIEEEMRKLAFAESNLMSVCRECHHEIHADMQSHSKESVKKNCERKTNLFFDRYFKE